MVVWLVQSVYLPDFVRITFGFGPARWLEPKPQARGIDSAIVNFGRIVAPSIFGPGPRSFCPKTTAVCCVFGITCLLWILILGLASQKVTVLQGLEV